MCDTLTYDWIMSHRRVITYMLSTVPSISRRTCTSTNGRTRSSRIHMRVPLICLTRHIHECVYLSSCIYERDSFVDGTDHPRTKTLLSSNSMKICVHLFSVIMSVPWKMLQCIAVFRIEVQCVAVCCSVLQCVAVCYSVLQCSV